MGILEQVLASIDNAKRVAGRNAQDLISSPSAYADKIVGHLRNSNANVVPTVADGELTNRPMTQDEITKKYVDASMDTLSGGLGVIKPKGGNWLSGKYGPEAQLKALKHTAMEPDTAAQSMALNNWIDNQLTKYVKNDMGAPTDPIRKLADAWEGEKATKLAQAEAKIKALRTKQEAQAATRGVPEEYLTRTRQDVLAAEEARDLIAENSGLHYTPGYTTEPLRGTIKRRAAAGFPEEGMAQTDLGRIWENTADSEVGLGTVADYQLPNNLKQDPWLAKADPNAPVYNLAGGPGFNHLTDELSNSLREGRLTPEQLAKMPVDQAVKHVAEINALRAVKSKQEQAMEAANIPLHKDYPDQGMSWRHLRFEPTPVPEGSTAVLDDATGQYMLRGPKGEDMGIYGETAEEVLSGGNRAQLDKWLIQEGDAMGHCVGGYCDDVASGRSSIYSLRDAKGQPHVTIETTPPDLEGPGSIDDAIGDRLWGEAFAKFGEEAEGTAPFMKYIEDGMREAAKDRVPMIRQIKGKNNEAPSAEHLPFIQDFIRSGKWSNIQDLQNAGMHKVGDKYLTMDELKATLARRTPEGSPILDQQGVDATDAMQRWIEDQDPNRI
jgi:hypothetical protein